MAPKRALQGCHISIYGQNPSWDRKTHSNKLSGWLSHLSGRLTSFSEQTTHLVVSKKRWTENPKPPVVETALQAKSQGRDIKIVTFDWLEDCLNSQSRKREVPYEWEVRDAQDAKRNGKAPKPKSAPGIMAEMFHESTEGFVDPEEKRKLEKQLEKEREIRKAKEQEEREEIIRQRKEKNKLFARGAKKAKDQLMTDTYHIYQDDTGFKFDILVTKVDPRANRNERWNLTVQMFESNTEPYDFAVATQISGTSRVSANNVICAIGTNYATAFHAFKSEFQFYTGTDWDARISTHIRRIREDKIQQGVGTGSSAPGSVPGVPVSEHAVREVPFEQRKFEYHPPGYGPKGEVTQEEKERLRAMGITVVDRSGSSKPMARAPAVAFDNTLEPGMRTAIEEWMKGADVSAAIDKAPTPPVEVQQAVVPDVDFNLMMAEEQYPFEKTAANLEAQHLPSGDGEVSNETRSAQAEVELAGQNGLARQNGPGHVDVLEGAAPHDTSVPLHSSPTLDNSGAADLFDWDGFAADIAGDQDWLDDQLAQVQEQSSMQPELPSFSTYPTAADTSFQRGTQEIGETQIAERAGGEFLEEFAGDVDATEQQQQQTPPASTTKPNYDNEPTVGDDSTSSKGLKALLGGFNLGSSILGKRKAPAEGGEVDGEAGKKAKMGQDA